MNQIGPGNLYSDVVPMTVISDQAATTDFAAFTAPYSGVARVFLSLATASVVDLMVTPIGGAQANAGAVLSGTSVPASQPQSFAFPVAAGASYALQVATAQTGNLVVAVGVARG